MCYTCILESPIGPLPDHAPGTACMVHGAGRHGIKHPPCTGLPQPLYGSGALGSLGSPIAKQALSRTGAQGSGGGVGDTCPHASRFFGRPSATIAIVTLKAQHFTSAAMCSDCTGDCLTVGGRQSSLPPHAQPPCCSLSPTDSSAPGVSSYGDQWVNAPPSSGPMGNTPPSIDPDLYSGKGGDALPHQGSLGFTSAFAFA